MVQRGEDEQTIKLEMTINQADLERQLGESFQSVIGEELAGKVAQAGRPSKLVMGRPDQGIGRVETVRPKVAKGGEFGGPVEVDEIGRGGRPTKPVTVRPDHGMGRQLQHLTRLAGIYFGISAMAKNSQIMSTSLSALGSVMGAIFDSFLAAYGEDIAKALTKIAAWIPVAAKAGEESREIISDVSIGAKEMKRQFQEKPPLEKLDMVTQFANDFLVDLGKTMGGGLVDPFMKKPEWLMTTGEKAVREVGAGRKFAGLDPLGVMSRAFGPTGEQRTETRQAVVEKARELLPEMTFNIQGATIDQILEAVRQELEVSQVGTAHSSGVGR